MKNKNKFRLPLILTFAILVITGLKLQAQDWAQWRGANQDGVYKEEGLKLDWTNNKPALSWAFKEAGSGYSAPTVVGATLYCQGAADGSDFAFALDTETGNLKWKQNLGELYVQDRGDGPRGSVTVDGDKLYLIRGAGQVHCLSATDGKMIWQKDFVKDFNGKIMSQWGYSESPLVDGNLVICTPGSVDGTLIALDKNTGDVVWRTKEWTDESGYSTPIVAEIYGVRQYIQQASNGVAGVSAEDGKLLWKIDYPPMTRRSAAVIPTPIFTDNMVYVTSGYNAGCMGIKFAKENESIKADTIYTNKNMINQHGGVVLVNDYVYGYHDVSGWVCQNFETGEMVWNNRSNDEGKGKGCVLAVNDRLLCLDERNGTLMVIAASPEGYKDFGSLPIPERSNIQTMDNKIWTHPVVSNGKLYTRDHDLLFCFDLMK